MSPSDCLNCPYPEFEIGFLLFRMCFLYLIFKTLKLSVLILYFIQSFEKVLPILVLCGMNHTPACVTAIGSCSHIGWC